MKHFVEYLTLIFAVADKTFARCPKYYANFDNVSCYHLSELPMSHENVKNFCNERNGSASKINPGDEAFVMDLLTTKDSTVFVDLIYNKTNRQFVWNDGSALENQELYNFSVAIGERFVIQTIINDDSKRTFQIIGVTPNDTYKAICSTKYFEDCSYTVSSSDCLSYSQNFTVLLTRKPELTNDHGSCNGSFRNDSFPNFDIIGLSQSNLCEISIMVNNTHEIREQQPCANFRYDLEMKCAPEIKEKDYTVTVIYAVLLSIMCIACLSITIVAAVRYRSRDKRRTVDFILSHVNNKIHPANNYKVMKF